MCRKIGYGLIATVLVLGVTWLVGAATLGTSKTNSLVSFSWSSMCNGANDQVPVEVEIERLKHEIKQLTPDIRANLRTVAKEQVEIENLKERIAHSKTKLAEQKAKIVAMNDELDAGVTHVKYDGRVYTRDRIREKLERDFDSFKRAEADLKAQEKMLDAKEKGLDAAVKQLENMKAQRKDLEVQLAELEAEVKTVRLAQQRSKFVVDDSRLGQIKSDLQKLKNRLKEEALTAELEGQFASEDIPVEIKKEERDLSKEIREYMGTTTNPNNKTFADKK